jgi:hypothetical protein
LGRDNLLLVLLVSGALGRRAGGSLLFSFSGSASGNINAYG